MMDKTHADPETRETTTTPSASTREDGEEEEKEGKCFWSETATADVHGMEFFPPFFSVSLILIHRQDPGLRTSRGDDESGDQESC